MNRWLDIVPAAHFLSRTAWPRRRGLSHFMEVIRAKSGPYENSNRGGYEKLELVENKGWRAVLIAEISAIRLAQTNPNSIFGRLGWAFF